MELAAKLDDIGKPAWIVLTILGFMVWWPIGLSILAFAIGSGRMGCWKRARAGRWSHGGLERAYANAERWCGGTQSSGNRAFDEYRVETLKRLEDEQREFVEFLERLRLAKDKAEFEEFLAERRRNSERPEATSQA